MPVYLNILFTFITIHLVWLEGHDSLVGRSIEECVPCLGSLLHPVLIFFIVVYVDKNFKPYSF